MTKKYPVVHFEIPVNDVKRGMSFYKKIFGWTFQKWETDVGDYYGVFTCDIDKKNMPKEKGMINGGLMKRKSAGQPFMNYITVPSITAMLTKIKKCGGKVIMPKTEIGEGMGWIANFKDPEGNVVGLHEMPKMQKKKKK